MCTSSLEVPAGTIDDLIAADLGRAVAWVTPSVREWVSKCLPRLPMGGPDEPLAGVDTLVVVGGGTLIDRAKAAAKDRSPALRLIAVPSIWGSGAEASPVLVLNGLEGKIIRKDAKYLPDLRIIWPELAGSISPDRLRHACGDCWAHCLEAFLSPLADAALRHEIADLIRDQLSLPIGNDPAWFELSAQACAAQARCSVGLVHGIAHTIESELKRELAGETWGHARLCSCMLFPVFQWTRRASDRCDHLCAEFDINMQRVIETLEQLFEPADYAKIVPTLTNCWPRILRDPCTRTHAALVRPRDLEFFRAGAFA